MNSIKTLYKLMEVSSRDLEIPDAYQRKLNTERVAKIVAGFNERMSEWTFWSRSFSAKSAV